MQSDPLWSEDLKRKSCPFQKCASTGKCRGVGGIPLEGGGHWNQSSWRAGPALGILSELSTENRHRGCAPREAHCWKRGTVLPGGALAGVSWSAQSLSLAAEKPPPPGWLHTRLEPQQPQGPARNGGRNWPLAAQFPFGVVQDDESLSVPEMKLQTAFSCKASEGQRTQLCVVKHLTSGMPPPHFKSQQGRKGSSSAKEES